MYPFILSKWRKVYKKKLWIINRRLLNSIFTTYYCVIKSKFWAKYGAYRTYSFLKTGTSKPKKALEMIHFLARFFLVDGFQSNFGAEKVLVLVNFMLCLCKFHTCLEELREAKGPDKEETSRKQHSTMNLSNLAKKMGREYHIPFNQPWHNDVGDW